MKSNALSQFVQKLFSDEETKKQFIADPESIMAGFELTETERKAILSKHAMMELSVPGSGSSNVAYGPMAAWI